MPCKQKLECRSKNIIKGASNDCIKLNMDVAARNAQLKRLETINNKGLRIAIGALCINKPENLLCKAGMLDLNHWRMIKAAITAVRYRRGLNTQ
jgi:hypothetical protein